MKEGKTKKIKIKKRQWGSYSFETELNTIFN